VQFSQRTDWPLRHNRLSELLERRRREGLPVLDLTVSNPTTAGFTYPKSDLLRAFSRPAILDYAPDPKGLPRARDAVRDHYRLASVALETADIVLTASTSEAYSYAFSLLCDPGDTVLVPSPSYPLFDYLAQLSGVALAHYALRYDGGWHVDVASMERAVTDRTRAIVLIHPHNPTGAFLKESEYRQICALAARHRLALIVDEVFQAYGFEGGRERKGTTAGTEEVLTLTLNGISKIAGLPQMKAGWIVLSGPENERRAAADRLETIADTYLSVNTPVQAALPTILAGAHAVAGQILGRVEGNYRMLRSLCVADSPASVLEAEGGWYGILRLPEVRSDEEWALVLLEKRGVYLFPGYFFDIGGCHLVVSLLADPALFQSGARALLDEIGGATSPARR
jgi:alanine-synthesizing transaminase